MSRYYLWGRKLRHDDCLGWVGALRLFYYTEDLSEEEVQTLLRTLSELHPRVWEEEPKWEFKEVKEPTPEEDKVTYLQMRHDWDAFEDLQKSRIYFGWESELHTQAERIVKHLRQLPRKERLKQPAGEKDDLLSPDPPVPVWDKDTRELCFNGQLLKKYKRAAENQTKILATFQEEKWPALVDNPFSKKEFQRRDEANRELNKIPGIHFFGDGTGDRIGWEPE